MHRLWPTDSSNTMNLRDDSISDFLEFLSRPESSAASLLWKDEPKATDMLRRTCKILFQRTEHLAKKHPTIMKDNSISSGLSALPELYMGSVDDSVDAETLWGQVELQNEALQKLLKRSVAQLAKIAEEGGSSIKLLDDVLSGDNDGEISVEDHIERQDHEALNVNVDDATRRVWERMERAMDDVDEEDPSDNSVNNIVVGEEDERRSVDASSIEDPAADELNDGFFDINDMEAFADEEEEYLPDEAFGSIPPDSSETADNRSFHQKQRDGYLDNNSEEVLDDELRRGKESQGSRKKYREDDEIGALYKLYDTPRDDDTNGEDADPVNVKAVDVFGKPKEKDFKKWNSRVRNKANDKGNDGDDDAWNEDGVDQAIASKTTGWNNDEEESDAVIEFSRGDTSSLYKEHGESKIEIDQRLKAGSSTFTKQQERLRRQTEELEREMIAEKPWQMTGESTSTSRPVNSLLESTPEFERAAKLAPVITIEHTADLEEIIKNRIIADDWDDLVPRELPDIGFGQKKGELPEVSQEKSKLGLGELYEREYLKKAIGYDVSAAEKESEEEKAKSEMKTLFANLCSKLDALSNYHFAPRPIAEEAEVRPVTKPAIAMEEVLPLHVSNARGVAAEEVYGAKRGREAILRNETELDQKDRKRARSLKKTARRKARKEKQADEKLISRLQPGLGLNNPYERRKMREELSEARARGKVTTGETDMNEYGGSGTFFKRMQEEAEQSINDRKTDGSGKKNVRLHPKSSSLKL